ncbi:MAG: DUF2092 domain-containing protein [Verrucomicrobiales bacterium]
MKLSQLRSRPPLSLSILALALAIASSGHAQKKESGSDAPAAPPIDPRAASILSRAVDFLANAKQYSTTAEVWQDLVQKDGTKLQFTKFVDIRLRRPDRLRVDVRTVTPKRSFYYDGKSLTFHDPQNQFYGTVEAPGTIDAMIESLEKTVGIELPLEDIMISKPFGEAAAAARSGSYLGLDPVLGRTCHHLAFRAEAISWQLWIEEGSVPALRKAVITFEDEERSPQFTALFDEWDLLTPLPDFVFSYDPLDGALEIEFETVKTPK